MPVLPNPTYLDLTGYQLTTASTVAAAFGLTDVRPAGSSDSLIMALVLNRANDPSGLLNLSWADRQTALTALNAAGALASTYGASQAEFDQLGDNLTSIGISLLGPANGFVSSAASRTQWVTLDASHFKALFETDLMVGTEPNGAKLSRRSRVCQRGVPARLSDHWWCPLDCRRAGYGNFSEATLTDVNAGDLIAMELTNLTHNDVFWRFANGTRW